MIDNWDELTTAEQDHFSSFNNFFCSMHILVGMADTTSSSLLTWEKTHFKTPAGQLYMESIKSQNQVS